MKPSIILRSTTDELLSVVLRPNLILLNRKQSRSSQLGCLISKVVEEAAWANLQSKLEAAFNVRLVVSKDDEDTVFHNSYLSLRP